MNKKVNNFRVKVNNFILERQKGYQEVNNFIFGFFRNLEVVIDAKSEKLLTLGQKLLPNLTIYSYQLLYYRGELITFLKSY